MFSLKTLVSILSEATTATESTSTWEPWKTGLLVSAAVVFVLGIGIYIGIYIWVRKYRKKILAKDPSIDTPELIRPNAGDYDLELSKELNADFYVMTFETVLNHAFQESLRKVKVVGKDTDFIALSMWKQLQFMKINNVNFDENKFKEIIVKHPSYSGYENIEQVDTTGHNGEVIKKQYDLIIVNQDIKDINTTYDKYIKEVREGGKLILIYNDKQLPEKEVDELDKHLAFLKQPHRLIKIKDSVKIITKKFK